MDRRVITLIVAAGLCVALVAGVLISRGGGGGSGDITDLSTKPTIEAPSDPPPDQLETKEIVTGDGAVAKSGDTVKVQYVSAIYETGNEFDATWDRNQPFTFRLGSSQVIPGWNRGIPGMRVGGRRELTIPPNLAYGAQGSPPTIPPDSTLIFIIDLLSVG